DCIPPVGRLSTGKQWDKTAALDVRGNRGARQLQKGGGKIAVDRQGLAYRAGLDTRRPSRQKRHAQRRLVHEALVVETVVAEEESLVTRVDHERVATQAVGIQPIEKPTDTVIHALDTSEVILEVALVFPALEGVPLEDDSPPTLGDLYFGRFRAQPRVPLAGGQAGRRFQFQITAG